MRVYRKVKIQPDGQAKPRWLMTQVALDRAGRPATRHVTYKGKRYDVDHGTFYLDSGHGASRRSIACGRDPAAVQRAIVTQAHVNALRDRGMEVPDAPEILDSRRGPSTSLRSLATDFKDAPPAGYTKKTLSKYRNAFESFASWGATVGILTVEQVGRDTIARWIGHMLKVERLDANTLVPKVRIILAELGLRGVVIKMRDRDLPSTIEREREIYKEEHLHALFATCTLSEYELFQTYMITGMRKMEGAFCALADINVAARTVRVVAKKQLGFIPKAYHERTIPVPQAWIELMLARAKRLELNDADLLFGTSRRWTKKGMQGGKADTKILEKLRQLARRNGLNCGQCLGMYQRKPVTCKTHAVCRVWGVHKFRHTYATSMLRDKVDIVTVSKWMGHKDLATTRIYLRALDAEMAQPQVENSTLATKFAGLVPAEGPPQRAKGAARQALRPRAERIRPFPALPPDVAG